MLFFPEAGSENGAARWGFFSAIAKEGETGTYASWWVPRVGGPGRVVNGVGLGRPPDVKLRGDFCLVGGQWPQIQRGKLGTASCDFR